MTLDEPADGPAEGPINSPAYWDHRFATDWGELGGPGQTAAFMRVAVELMPDWLVATIRRDQLEVVDWGCAEGDGIPLLEQTFPESAVVGIDVSEIAIETAVARYPQSRFECIDLMHSNRTTDVIVTSNVVEHFADPLAVLHDLSARASSYVVVLVPFLEDPLIDEHEVAFDHSSFPLALGDGKRLTFARSIDLRWRRRSPWPGMQMMVVYSGRDDGATLADLDRSRTALERRVGRQRSVERVARPVYRALRVDRWLLPRLRRTG